MAPPTPPTPPAPPAPPAGDTALSDAEIAAIASTAHQIEIDAATLAKSKTQNKEVEAFAQMMITDHSRANEQGKALLTKLDMKPADNDLSRQMKTKADATKTRLEALTGVEFDKAYVADQVAAHQEVLDTLDKMLITNADNADLKAHLTAVRPTVAAHLEHARKMDADLE